MTTDKQFNKDARELADAEGISYTVAHRPLTSVLLMSGGLRRRRGRPQ
ncbi:hypothetical protein ACIGZH_23530 [Streptomyces sp. NPDC058319]